MGSFALFALGAREIGVEALDLAAHLAGVGPQRSPSVLFGIVVVEALFGVMVRKVLGLVLLYVGARLCFEFREIEEYQNVARVLRLPVFVRWTVFELGLTGLGMFSLVSLTARARIMRLLSSLDRRRNSLGSFGT